MRPAATLAPFIERFFTQRLISQRQVSPHTVSSYRDTFRLLLAFARTRLQRSPAQLALEEIDAPLIAAFLDDLEKSRGNTARSRNLRLTAIRSFFQYAAYEAPTHAAQIQRVLAMPSKRCARTLVSFLPDRKSRRSSLPRTSAPGADVATRRSCSWRCKRACACPR